VDWFPTNKKHFTVIKILILYLYIIEQVILVEQELLTLPEHLSTPPGFSGVRVARSLVLCVVFVDRSLSFCTFFFWPLCGLFFFDLRILIVPLVSSNSSYHVNFDSKKKKKKKPIKAAFVIGSQ
jgi:hypothetical protein